MAQQSFAGFALIIALGFAVMALVSCASSEQRAVAAIPPVDIASVEDTPAVPEFHGARIGADGFRSRVPSEN
jgi:hypothetical protein